MEERRKVREHQDDLSIKIQLATIVSSAKQGQFIVPVSFKISCKLTQVILQPE